MKKKNRPGCAGTLIALALSLALTTTAAGQAPTPEPATPQPPEQPVAVEVFHGPELLEIERELVDAPGAPGKKDSPSEEFQKGREGWVVLNFMVDTKGRPFEVGIAESSGSDAFEEDAVRMTSRWKFKPAMLGDKPVTASQLMRVKYSNDQPPARTFGKAYEKLMTAIQAGDRARADELFSALEVKNLSEEAYVSFARFGYHRKWGTEAEQLEDLKLAIAGEKKARYLNKETFVAALTGRLLLQMKAQDYGGALSTWKTLQPIAPANILAELQGTMDRLEALRTSDRPVRMSSGFGSRTSWSGVLFRNRFEVVVASGRIAEIKLRCEKQYVFFRYEPGVQYKVDGPSGTCGIELVGDPETKFELIQSS